MGRITFSLISVCRRSTTSGAVRNRARLSLSLISVRNDLILRNYFIKPFTASKYCAVLRLHLVIIWAIPPGVMLSFLILYCRCYGKRKHGSRLLTLYSSNKNGPNRPRTD